jgi:chemotaxis protein MotB
MKVSGMADRELLTPQEPTSPRNRRITIIMMRGSYFRDPKAAPTTRTLLSAPDASFKKTPPPQVEAPPAPPPPPALPLPDAPQN